MVVATHNFTLEPLDKALIRHHLATDETTTYVACRKITRAIALHSRGSPPKPWPKPEMNDKRLVVAQRSNGPIRTKRPAPPSKSASTSPTAKEGRRRVASNVIATVSRGARVRDATNVR